MSQGIRIVALGDSITHGAGHADVTEQTTFRHLVATDLADRLGRPVEVVNAGVNGDIVPGALERLQADVIDHRPDIATIMFGGNDAGYYRPETDGFADTPRVALADFRATLAEIVTRITSANVTAVLMTSPPMTDRYWGADLEPYRRHGLNYLVAAYAQAVRDLAAARDIPLVDVYAAFSDVPGALDFFPDGLHPDPRGHRLIADRLLDRLVPLLRG